MNHPFKPGDRVYHFHLEWCTFDESQDMTRPSQVNITTEAGKAAYSNPNYLSFTEYTLQGFSWDRPIVPPKPGDIVYYQLKHAADGTVWTVGRCESYDADTGILYLVTGTRPDALILELDLHKPTTIWTLKNPFDGL